MLLGYDYHMEVNNELNRGITGNYESFNVK